MSVGKLVSAILAAMVQFVRLEPTKFPQRVQVFAVPITPGCILIVLQLNPDDPGETMERGSHDAGSNPMAGISGSLA
jgi:hypothetical protein